MRSPVTGQRDSWTVFRLGLKLIKCLGMGEMSEMRPDYLVTGMIKFICCLANLPELSSFGFRLDFLIKIPQFKSKHVFFKTCYLFFFSKFTFFVFLLKAR